MHTKGVFRKLRLDKALSTIASRHRGAARIGALKFLLVLTLITMRLT